MSTSYSPHITFTHPPFEDGYSQFFPLKVDGIAVGSVPQPREPFGDGPWGPVLLTPHSPTPYGLFLSAALLIHSILAAASCVTETARNFCLAFNSEEIPVTGFPLLKKKKKIQSSALENSAFPLGTIVHRKCLSCSLFLATPNPPPEAHSVPAKLGHLQRIGPSRSWA